MRFLRKARLPLAVLVLIVQLAAGLHTLGLL
jgi:hypothetical protein